MTTPSKYLTRGVRPAARVLASPAAAVVQAGHLMWFFIRIPMTIPSMLRNYGRELMRLLSDISWGNGSIVVGGGTIGVAAVLGLSVGALAAVEGYNALNLLGLGPATGLIASSVCTRELAPVMVGLAFTTQAGCRFTAQLGAMRINEEIDAVESLGVDPIGFLVATRVAAATICALPLLMVSLAVSYLAAVVVVGVTSGQADGTYMHYFSMFLSGTDVVYAVVKCFAFIFVAATIQCYYGFYAVGGPAGVGVAAGRAMRATITSIIITNMLLTMAFWGVDVGARFGG